MSFIHREKHTFTNSQSLSCHTDNQYLRNPRFFLYWMRTFSKKAPSSSCFPTLICASSRVRRDPCTVKNTNNSFMDAVGILMLWPVAGMGEGADEELPIGVLPFTGLFLLAWPGGLLFWEHCCKGTPDTWVRELGHPLEPAAWLTHAFHASARFLRRFEVHTCIFCLGFLTLRASNIL